MILLPEKAKDTSDGESPETEAPQTLSSSSPTSSSSRAIASPALPTLENAPPPLYSDSYAGPPTSSSSYFTPTLSATENTMSVQVPTSFSRVPSRDVMYPSFPPIFLVATGKTLDKGFPYASPPSSSDPHPFVSHDVTEGDWTSFLEEVRLAAALTDKQIRRSHLPIVDLLPIINSLASYGVKQIMKHQNISKVIACIDQWNRHFFEQRKMRVILMKGQVTVKGQPEYLNDAASYATSPSSSRGPEFDDRKHDEDHPSTSTSAVGISQGLIDKNDDIYRLFVVPLS
jgi:hypothetical protein